MMGTFDFSILGYEDTIDELHAIQDVRNYYALLNAQWPFLLYFADLESESLLIIITCLMSTLATHKREGERGVKVEMEPMEILGFIKSRFAGLNLLAERAEMSELEIYNRTKAIFEYFNFPFDS